MMTKIKTSFLLLAVMEAANVSTIDARHSGTCVSGGDSRGLFAPRSRRYDYHRRPPDAFDLVSDIFSIPFYNTNSLFRHHHPNQLSRMEFSRSAPRYAISDSEDGKVVELTMEVPGVAAKDMSVEVEDGNILRIRGSRTIRESGSLVQSEFDQSFQLDQDIDVDNISVTLSSGILTVTAPRKPPVVKRIPLKITEEKNDADHIAVKNKVEESSVVDKNSETTSVPDGEQKDKSEEKQTNDNNEDDLVITEEEDA